MASLELTPAGQYRCTHPDCGATLLKCANYAHEGVCNRMVAVDAQGTAPRFCDCCVYNAVIPDLSIEGHRQRWAELEAAKRRLFYTLDLIGLPHGTEADRLDPPLSFAFMTDAVPADGLWRAVGDRRVYTGHDGGRITINVKEADVVERERLRVDFNESHRTLIGHFRHEIGHYYWELLVRGRDEASCRQAFGDHDRPSYADARERYYAQGPPAGWEASWISAYATMHPWEDFAETFAFYLAMVTIVDTARHVGMLPADDGTRTLDAMLRGFCDVGLAANELNRDMGLKDLVPQVVSPAVEAKLGYVDRLVRAAARPDRPPTP